MPWRSQVRIPIVQPGWCRALYTGEPRMEGKAQRREAIVALGAASIRALRYVEIRIPKKYTAV